VGLNKGLQIIGDQAFTGCRSLLHLSVPSSVTTIGDHAFCCFALKYVRLCNGILKVGRGTNSYCYSLLRINIPPSLSMIGVGAFESCDLFRDVAISPASTLGQ